MTGSDRRGGAGGPPMGVVAVAIAATVLFGARRAAVRCGAPEEHAHTQWHQLLRRWNTQSAACRIRPSPSRSTVSVRMSAQHAVLIHEVKGDCA